MPGVEDHEMVQPFSPECADQALGVRILPGALRSGEDFFDAERRDASAYFIAAKAVPVADKLCLRRFAGLNRMRPVAPDEANGKVQENALQSWPFFHWSLYPLISLAPGRH